MARRRGQASTSQELLNVSPAPRYSLRHNNAYKTPPTTPTPPPKLGYPSTRSHARQQQEQQQKQELELPPPTLLELPDLNTRSNTLLSESSFVSNQGGVSPDGPYAHVERLYQHFKKYGSLENFHGDHDHDYGYESDTQSMGFPNEFDSAKDNNPFTSTELSRISESIFENNDCTDDQKSISSLGYEPSWLGTMFFFDGEENGSSCPPEESYRSSISSGASSFSSSSQIDQAGEFGSNSNAPPLSFPFKKPNESFLHIDVALSRLKLAWTTLKALCDRTRNHPKVKPHTRTILASLIVCFIFFVAYGLIWNYRDKKNDAMPLDIAWDSDEFRALIANEVGTIFSKEIQKVLQQKVESGFNREEVLESMRREMQEVFTRELLEKKYGVSRPDFALSTVGARIIPHLTSLSYAVVPERWLAKFISYLPWRRNIVDNAPVITIAPGIYDGLCWSFAGTKGVLAVRLAKTAYVTAITYEHISREIAVRDEVSPAPKDFEVWGLPDTGLEVSIHDFSVFLGHFTYDVESSPRQIFTAANTKIPIRAVLLKIKNNWGNSEFTRIYRFRVHGDRVE